MKFNLDELSAPMTIEKIKILGAVLELSAKQPCQASPFASFFVVDWLVWQGYLAGSSKTAPRILKFSNAMGANYLSELILMPT